MATTKRGSGSRAKRKAAATKAKRANKAYRIPERLAKPGELKGKIQKPGKTLPFKKKRTAKKK